MITLPPVPDSLAAAAWFKSSYSGAGGDCVQVADGGPVIGMRDSKDPAGGTLRLTRLQFAHLLAGLKDGEFDDLVT